MSNRFACTWPYPATLLGGELLAVKIRLARVGAKKTPFYRIVAADSRSPRDGRFIEILGRYDPRTDPSSIQLDVERTQVWIDNGAQMTPTVAKLLEIARNPDAEAPAKEVRPSKKSQAKASGGPEATAETSEPETSADDTADAPTAEEAEEASGKESAEVEPE